MDTDTDLYKIAQMDDSRILKDAWVGNYDAIISRTEDVKNSVNKHILGTDGEEASVQGIFNTWKTDMAEKVTPSIGDNLDSLKTKTKKVSEASKELSGKVTELIKKLGKEIEKT
jgi:hypothetical protein